MQIVRAAMDRIQPLAHELLVKILSFLSQNDLSNISLCSKRLQHICQPLLYTTVVLSLKSMVLFMRTLSHQPDLVPFTKAIQLYDCSSSSIRQREAPEILDSIELDFFAQSSLQKEQHRPYYSHEGIWLAALLSRLVNLTTLEWHFDYYPKYVIDILRPGADVQFPTLSTVRLRMDRSTHMVDDLAVAASSLP